MVKAKALGVAWPWLCKKHDTICSKSWPIVWKIASKKIERVVPVGLKFGPGWIGENEALLKQMQSLFIADKYSESSIPCLLVWANKM
jgi:hypothetical protein